MHTILLVDGDGTLRALTDEIQRRTHCRVLTASSGAEALTVARREHPDLLFLDAEMPGMTGADVCRVLKADKQSTRAPIVLVSSSPEEAQRAGADSTLSKPIDETAFFDALRKYLQIFPRDEARSAAGWSVTFWREGVQYSGTIRDLSLGGFFVRTPVRQPVGARIEVSFDVPGEKPDRTVVAEAIVVRTGHELDRGLGCRFFRLSSSSRQHLEECLRLLTLGEAPAAPQPEAGNRKREAEEGNRE
jgi:CheY-like chemotaxis protein